MTSAGEVALAARPRAPGSPPPARPAGGLPERACASYFPISGGGAAPRAPQAQLRRSGFQKPKAVLFPVRAVGGRPFVCRRPRGGPIGATLPHWGGGGEGDGPRDVPVIVEERAGIGTSRMAAIGAARCGRARRSGALRVAVLAAGAERDAIACDAIGGAAGGARRKPLEGVQTGGQPRATYAKTRPDDKGSEQLDTLPARAAARAPGRTLQGFVIGPTAISVGHDACRTWKGASQPLTKCAVSIESSNSGETAGCPSLRKVQGAQTARVSLVPGGRGGVEWRSAVPHRPTMTSTLSAR